jgi:hypothetical protein
MRSKGGAHGEQGGGAHGEQGGGHGEQGVTEPGEQGGGTHDTCTSTMSHRVRRLHHTGAEKEIRPSAPHPKAKRTRARLQHSANTPHPQGLLYTLTLITHTYLQHHAPESPS